MEERFALVWKLVLKFLSDDDIDLKMLTEAISARRKRVYIKACGLKSWFILCCKFLLIILIPYRDGVGDISIIIAMKQLLATVSMSSIKREIVASLVPAMNKSDRAGLLD